MFCSIISTDPSVLDDYDSAVEMIDSITQQYPEISVSYFATPDLKNTVYMNNGWKPDENFRLEDRAWYKDAVSSSNG